MEAVEDGALGIVSIDYTNWRGLRRHRRVRPTGRMVHGTTPYHTKPQWLFEAYDIDGNPEPKWFAMADVHRWKNDSGE